SRHHLPRGLADLPGRGGRRRRGRLGEGSAVGQGGVDREPDEPGEDRRDEAVAEGSSQNVVHRPERYFAGTRDAPAGVAGALERDVVIVGGGHNGLACAAYLARAGLDVLVLERRDILGGAAATEE